MISLAKIDDDGQELRYPTNREGEKSLDDIAIVNLPHIRKSLETMSDILTRLNYAVRDLTEERSIGSHTKECSRKDLQNLAAML